MRWLPRILQRSMRVTPVTDPARVVYDFRKCELFRGVPEENVRELASKTERVDGKAGAKVIRAGDPGDYYYFLLKGEASVLRRKKEGHLPDEVAVLGDGDSFGEEALISDAPRNATVKFKTDSSVMRVPRDAFIDYIQSSLVDWLSLEEARAAVKEGARWIDVREKKDGGGDLYPEAVSIPISTLRDRLSELDAAQLNICICGNGRLSAAAAFILRQRRYHVAALKGGLRSMRADRHNKAVNGS